MMYTGSEEDDFDIFCAIATTTCDAFQGVELNRRPPMSGGGGGGGGGGSGAGAGLVEGGGGLRTSSADTRFPPGISRDPNGPKRITSNLSEDDPSKNGDAAGDDHHAAPAAEGSSSAARRAAQQGNRQASRTPSRNPGKGKGRLELTTARDGPTGPNPSRAAGSNGHSSQAHETTEENPLFLPGPSQEEIMSQALGLSEEELRQSLDDAEEEDWAAEQAAKDRKGKGKARRGDEMELDEEEDVAAEEEARMAEEAEKARVDQAAAAAHRLIETNRIAAADAGFQADLDIFEDLYHGEGNKRNTPATSSNNGSNGHNGHKAQPGPSRSRDTNNANMQTPAPARDARRSASTHDTGGTSRPSRVPETERPTRSTGTGSGVVSGGRLPSYTNASPTKRRASSSRSRSRATPQGRDGNGRSRSKSRNGSSPSPGRAGDGRRNVQPREASPPVNGDDEEIGSGDEGEFGATQHPTQKDGQDGDDGSTRSVSISAVIMLIREVTKLI